MRYFNFTDNIFLLKITVRQFQKIDIELYNLLVEFYKDAKKDDCQILQVKFTSDADIIPDYQKNTLTVRLHSLSTPRANRAAKKLCDFLNETETVFPLTNMRLIYETVAL